MHGHSSYNIGGRSGRPCPTAGRGAATGRLARAPSPRARRSRGPRASCGAAATLRRGTHQPRCRTGGGRRRARASPQPLQHLVALVLDTGPILALLDAGDPAHARSVEMVEELREDLVIPSCVLVEVEYWAR